MRAKIRMFGWLQIERKGIFKQQFCPYRDREVEEELCCGDWCPLFNERSNGTAERKKYVTLACAWGGLSHEIVEDERDG